MIYESKFGKSNTATLTDNVGGPLHTRVNHLIALLLLCQWFEVIQPAGDWRPEGLRTTVVEFRTRMFVRDNMTSRNNIAPCHDIQNNRNKLNL